eukprot:CAMPEP_0181311032 /NCGR_PEP_ID=MMETSP1101-20121128/12913_1 /TAXON_ID=46948 /ORGANISM="Rhodomonas abbreviata, Strain Caron Lab Isolate" /LENGTH=58 /DNA_ID=CAMNT_0023417721 /DNA_START=244 /DNA_END=420 /DNA_ORIENTATION=+
MLMKLYDNINPFTEQIVGEWSLPDEILMAPAGGMTWEPTDPEVQYYGPMGKDWIFAND